MPVGKSFLFNFIKETSYQKEKKLFYFSWSVTKRGMKQGQVFL